MKYINKYQYADEAHAINVEFLQDCYQGPGLQMIPRVDGDQSFDDFKKCRYRFGHDGKRGWEYVLMEEQGGRCCYCMRKLVKGRLSIEHVVPRALKGARGVAEYERYASIAPAIRDFVEVADVFAWKSFAHKEEIDLEVRMPHVTAEGNLLLACNGKRDVPDSGCCCNNARQDAYMLPLMLMENCEERVDYDEYGLVSVLPEEGTLTGIIKDLNDETLKTVRKIWHRISGTPYSLAAIHAMTSYLDKVVLLKTAFGENNFETMDESIKNYAGSVDGNGQDFYWKLLLSYDWFYGFYHRRREREQ